MRAYEREQPVPGSSCDHLSPDEFLSLCLSMRNWIVWQTLKTSKAHILNKIFVLFLGRIRKLFEISVSCVRIVLAYFYLGSRRTLKLSDVLFRVFHGTKSTWALLKRLKFGYVFRLAAWSTWCPHGKGEADLSARPGFPPACNMDERWEKPRGNLGWETCSDLW